MARPKPIDSPTLIAVRLRGDQVVALQHIRETTGISQTWQVRKGVDLWLASQDVKQPGPTGTPSKGKGRSRRSA